MEGHNLGKRTRQACEPCRRKKSRCPGERPVCSYCDRLGQQCVYKSGPEVPLDSQQARHNRKMEFRLGALEGKMDRLIQHLSPENSISRLVSSSPAQSAPPAPARLSEGLDGNPIQETGRVPSLRGSFSEAHPKTHLLDLAQTYLAWIHGQPITLFEPTTFVDSIHNRDKELLDSIHAIAERFPPGTLTLAKQQRLSEIASGARRAVMMRITDGEVELSTLQSLCILSIVDFADGKPARASLNLVIAEHVKHAVQTSLETELELERKLCFESISILQKLHGCIIPAIDMMSNPSSNTLSKLPELVDLPEQDHTRTPCEILLYAARLCDVWQMARAYAAARVKPDAPPPWDPQSDFSAIMNRHLNLDCLIPLKFRYCANSSIVNLTAEELNERRHYWSAFLFIQLVYSTIPCLLNHPFLISMRLRNFRHTIPQSFIQQSYEQITRCMGWIVYFIDLLERKSFQVSDPVFAHCVAIVSTIHLQHSFVKDPTLRRKATNGFEKCMRFLRRLGSMWPSVTVMADNLQRLQESVVVVPQRDTSNTESPLEQPAFSIDARLLQDILIYDRAGQPNANADESLLGKTLASQTALRDAEERTAEAEYNLIGSAGLSGHTAVANQGLVYAPEDEPDSEGSSEASLHANPHAVSDMGITLGDIYLEGIGGYGDQDNMFMQANDYGRAIGGWLDFESA